MKLLMLATLLNISMMSLAAIANEGSSFQEVVQVLRAPSSPSAATQNEEWKVYQTGMPHYPVNSQTVFSTSPTLVKDAQRTVNEKYDYYDYLPKKLHPNGVCITGEWEINQATKYTGYYKSGAKGLFVGRISVTMENVVRGDKRGFGFAGKIFPTLNEVEVVKTANFFTVDVLLGTKIENFLETRMTNEPETGFDFSMIALGLRIASALKQADENPNFRPVSQIAKLSESQSSKSPKWMRISAASNTIKNHQGDFRNEVLQAVIDNKELVFNIDVSDTVSDRNASDGWKSIGTIKVKEAMVSYGCDRRLHFAHPKLAD